MASDYMTDNNPHVPNAKELGIQDVIEGREPLWYQVGDSYVNAESGKIGNPIVAAAYLRAYATEQRDERIRQFLALPVEAMPSAQILDDGESVGDAWDLLRHPECRLGERVRLHADRDGWRDGIVVQL